MLDLCQNVQRDIGNLDGVYPIADLSGDPIRSTAWSSRSLKSSISWSAFSNQRCWEDARHRGGGMMPLLEEERTACSRHEPKDGANQNTNGTDA